MTAPDGLLAEVVALALAAGEVALRHYRGETAARAKADASPVTDADEASEAVILAGLGRLDPGVPAISEEAVARGEAPAPGSGAPARFWLIDPLDGTREFVARNGEFTVNIGLVEGDRPVLGVVHAPALAATYAGQAGRGAWVRRDGGPWTALDPRPARDGQVVVSSRSHGDRDAIAAFLDGTAIAEHRRIGSAIKFGMVAEGLADIYPRFGPTMEWDTAAGHAILEAAGGTVETAAGGRLRYGKPGLRNPDFIARRPIQ